MYVTYRDPYIYPCSQKFYHEKSFINFTGSLSLSLSLSLSMVMFFFGEKFIPLNISVMLI